MSYYTASYTDIRTNDTTRFRAQGKWISDQLELIGWTKQGDSGQIDWTTVAAPGAANTSMGYEIRKSSEGLYLKIEYGSGQAYAYSKGLWITLGDGTDGAGTMHANGTWLGRVQLTSATAYSGGSARAGKDYVAGAADRIMIALTDDTNATYGVCVIIEKSHSLLTGADDTYGWTIAYFGRDSAERGGVWHVAPRSPNVYSSTLDKLAHVHFVRGIGDASNVPVSPLFCCHTYYGLSRLRDGYLAAYSLATFQGTVTIDGKTYLCAWGNSTMGTPLGTAQAVAMALYARYE